MELAQLFISSELGVPDGRDYSRKRLMRNLYSLYNPNLLGLIDSDLLVANAENICKTIDIKIFNQGYPFNSLRGLAFVVRIIDSNTILLTNRMSDFPIVFEFIIKYLSREIKFLLESYALRRHESKISKNILLDYYHFLRLIILNGRIELYSDGGLLTRLDSFIPVNIIPDVSKIDKAISEIQSRG